MSDARVVCLAAYRAQAEPAKAQRRGLASGPLDGAAAARQDQYGSPWETTGQQSASQ